MYRRKLNKILLVVVGVLAVCGGYGQTFSPTASNANFPTGTDVSYTNEEDALNVVCTSCSGNENIETFRVLANDDGTTIKEYAYFQWVVLGGSITEYSGTNEDESIQDIAGVTRHYIQTQGISNDSSSITVEYDTSLPDTVWVAVRQSSEFGCTDQKWSVHLMKADETDPEIQFEDYAEWIDSLVVVFPSEDLPFALELSAFSDTIHSSENPVATSSFGNNIDPVPSDNCAINQVISNISSAGGSWDDSYNTGEHKFESWAYDCQGNDSTYTQRLFVYDAADFSLTAPADYRFPNDDCEKSHKADFSLDTADLVITYPADWSPLDTTWSIISEESHSGSGCVYNRTRDYTVTLIHDNNHNTRDITATRTYSYVVDNSLPVLVTKNITVDLDVNGNASIVAADIVERLYDDCVTSDTANIIVNSFSPVSFDGSDVGANTVTLEVQDSCGNSISETATVTINDITKPVVEFCPNDSIVGVELDQCDSTLTPFQPVFTDSGDGIDSVYWEMTGDVTDAADKNFSDIQYIGEYTFPVGTTTILYTAKDKSGNTIICSFDITVNDNQPVTEPVWSDIAHIAWEERKDYSITIPAVTDNCSISYYTLNVNSTGTVDISGEMGNSYDLPELNVGDNTLLFEFSDGVNNGSYTMTIHVDSRPELSVLSATNPLCHSEDNGEIQLNWDIDYENNVEIQYTTAVDGNGTYTAMTGKSLLSLFAGTYYFRVKTDVDVDGSAYTSYSDTISETLVEPPLIDIDMPESAVTHETCLEDPDDGEIHTTIIYTYGDPDPDPFRDYTVEWTMDGNIYDDYKTDGDAATDSVHLTGLDSSVYVITVTDIVGCSNSQTYTLYIDNGVDPTITVTGGVTFPDPDGLVDGRVVLNVDAGNCDRTIQASDNIDPLADDGTCSTGLEFEHDYAPAPDPTTLEGAVFDVDTTTVTWTATDPTGNSVDTTYNVIIVDNIDPSFNGEDQADQTFAYCRNVRTIPLPSNPTDNCEVDSVICNLTGTTNWNDDILLGTKTTGQITFDPTVTTSVRWTIKDASGNKVYDDYDIDFTEAIDTTSNFHVTDITCNGDDDGEIIVDFTGGAGGDYDIKVGSQPIQTGPNTNAYTFSNLQPSDYTVTITDADNCSFSFDTLVWQPGALQVALESGYPVNNDCFESGEGELAVNITGGREAYSYTWTGPDSYTSTDEDISTLETGNYSLTVTDARGCTTNGNYEVESLDTDKPTFTLSETYVENATSLENFYLVPDASWDPGALADDCDVIVYHDYNDPGDIQSSTLQDSIFPIGSTEVNWYISDLSGNDTTVTVTYTVVDDQPPIFNNADRALDVTKDLINVCDTVLFPNGVEDIAFDVFDNQAFPEDSLNFIRSDDATALLTDPFEVTNVPVTITWTLQDALGLTAEYVQIITLMDGGYPQIDWDETIPLPVYLNAAGVYNIRQRDYEDSISDNCLNIDSLSLLRDPADQTSISFNCLDIDNSPIEVTVYAEDSWGLHDSWTREVNVLDTIEPIINSNALTIYLDENAEATLSADDLDAGSTDNCGGVLDFGMEIDGTIQYGIDSIFDCSELGNNTVTFAVRDKNLNEATTNVTVRVRDTLAPLVSEIVPKPSVYLNSSGSYTITDPYAIIDTVVDNCSGFNDITIVANPIKVDCDDLGDFTIQVEAFDALGNDSAYNVDISVVDTIKPTPVLKDITLRLHETNSTTILDPADFDNGSYDNCDSIRFEITDSIFTCNDIGEHVVTVSVYDGSDNVDTGDAIVTVISPLTPERIELNACASTPYFSAEVYPEPDSLSQYEWYWTVYESRNQGNANNNIFCPTSEDVGYTGNPNEHPCGNTSTDTMPYYNTANSNDLYIGLQIRPKGGTCWSDTIFTLLSAAGGGGSNDIVEEIDVCLNQEETYTVTDINGADDVTWEIVNDTGDPVSDVGEIDEANIDTDLTAEVPYTSVPVTWLQETSGYSETDYLKLTVSYPETGSGNERVKACDDIYKWYPFVHGAPDPQFDEVTYPYDRIVCINDTVSYHLTESYETYSWNYIDAARVIGGGSNIDSFITVVWDGALNVEDSIKVTVFTDIGCYNDTVTDKITIEDNDHPEFDDVPSDFNVTLQNESGDCQKILTSLSVPTATDYCGGDEVAGVNYAYTITNRNIPAEVYTGNELNFKTRTLDVGVYDVEWVATDAGGNRSDERLTDDTDRFIYTITIEDNEDPVFTTTINSRSAATDLTCSYQHTDDTWDMTATDNCAIDSIIVVVYNDSPAENDTLKILEDYTFNGGSTTVKWIAVDIYGHTIEHSFNVNLIDENDPSLVFGTMPAEYDGTFAENDDFYLFEEATSDSGWVTINADITDPCAVGDVYVSFEDPDGSTRGPFLVTDISGDNHSYSDSIALGRTRITWEFSDKGGNIRYKDHYGVYVNQNGFTCNASVEEPWGFEWGEESDSICNPGEGDFTVGTSNSLLPPWFETLTTNNILSYNLTRNSDLHEPYLVGCETTRDREFIMDYNIALYGGDLTDPNLVATTNCSQVYYYTTDTEGPDLSAISPQDLILECGVNEAVDHTDTINNWLAAYANVDVNNITDNCISDPSNFIITDDYSALNGLTCEPGSVTTVTFTVADECDQITTYTADIILDDTQAPQFTGGSWNILTMPADLLDSEGNAVSCDGGIPAAWEKDVDFFVQDSCDSDVTYNFTQTNNKNENGSFGDADDNNYRITRTWTIEDDCGNSNSHTQLIDVVDVIPAIFDQAEPADQTVSCDNIPTAPTLTYTEACDLNPFYKKDSVNTQSGTLADDSYYNYMITHTWRVADNTQADTTEYDQVLTVWDNEPPTIQTDASSLTVECDGTGNTTDFEDWLADYGGAVATDNCASQAFLTWDTIQNTNGWVVGTGNVVKYIDITFTVDDPSSFAGTASTSSVTFTIEDTEIPTISDSLNTIGPYGSVADVPVAYSTIAELTAVHTSISFNDNCVTDENNLSITLSHEEDNISASSCTYTITRYYYVEDLCGNRSATFTEDITVNDGVDPEILKASVSSTECATDPFSQQTTVSGLALVAADLDDNCNPNPGIYDTPGDYFIDNAASGAIKYRVYNEGVEETSGWTTGNLDSYTFNQGTNDVWYRVTDDNGNSTQKNLYSITVLEMPVIATEIGDEGETGIGGNSNPLRYSTHTYNLTMYDYSSNWGVGNTGWDVYDDGAEDDNWAGNNSETAYTQGTDYSITESQVSGDNVQAEITFNGDLAEGDYVLVFTEINDDGCFDQKYYAFTLGAPFDVDIAESENICPNDDNAILDYGNDVNTDGTGRTTTVTYTITLESSSYENNWQFDYAVTIAENGGGGNDASVASVSFTDVDGDGNITNPLTATGNVTVTYDAVNTTTEVSMEVVYNDVHGTTQHVKVALSNIQGSASEEDLNVTLGTVEDGTVGLDGDGDQNETEHLIQNLPLPGNIDGVE